MNEKEWMRSLSMVDLWEEGLVIWGLLEIKEEKCGGDRVLVIWGRGVKVCLVLAGFGVRVAV